MEKEKDSAAAADVDTGVGAGGDADEGPLARAASAVRELTSQPDITQQSIKQAPLYHDWHPEGLQLSQDVIMWTHLQLSPCN